MMPDRYCPTLIMVVPCYNEEEVLPMTSRMFLDKLMYLISEREISEDSRVLLVNDGSKDTTWNIIWKLTQEETHFIGINLSRNFGHQRALLAGLMEARSIGDIVISIDCDGQDDINAMDLMIREYKNGADIVYGVRSQRDTDTFFKRFTAEQFYKLLRRLGGEVVYNHADYRLVSAKVLDRFADFNEVNIFLRGMFPLVGFKSTLVYYERHERIAGKSKYTFFKMLGLAVDGITSLSVKPIRFITGLGIGISLLTFFLIIYVLVSYFTGNTVPGWSSSLIATCFIGGIQLISLGVIGEYVGKIYMETKHRPRYIISETTWKEDRADRECK